MLYSPMPLSDANRQNALLSTGPKSPEGKAASALNGLRHIGLARSILLKTESPEKFCALLDTYYDEHNPQTATERALVDMMATARGRQIRMSNLEAATVSKTCELQKSGTTDAAKPPAIWLSLLASAAQSPRLPLPPLQPILYNRNSRKCQSSAFPVAHARSSAGLTQLPGPLH